MLKSTPTWKSTHFSDSILYLKICWFDFSLSHRDHSTYSPRRQGSSIFSIHCTQILNHILSPLFVVAVCLITFLPHKDMTPSNNWLFEEKKWSSGCCLYLQSEKMWLISGLAQGMHPKSFKSLHKMLQSYLLQSKIADIYDCITFLRFCRIFKFDHVRIFE